MEPSIRAMIGSKYDEGIVHEVGAILDKIYTDKQPKNYTGRDLFKDYLNRAFFLPEPAKRTSHSSDLSDRLGPIEKHRESDSASILKHLSSILGYYQDEGPANIDYSSGNSYSSGNPNPGYSSGSRCYQ